MVLKATRLVISLRHADNSAGDNLAGVRLTLSYVLEVERAY